MGFVKKLDVPSEFQPKCSVRYPSHQVGPRMEEYMHTYLQRLMPTIFLKEIPGPDAIYVPIYWDNWHVNHGFGRQKKELQEYINRYRCDGRKYWTVCEYRDGTLMDWPNLTVFCAGGNGPSTDIPIPLICDPHPSNPQDEPKYRATFCGSITTHPVRETLLMGYGERPGYHICGSVGTDQFEYLMDNSKWALCPRGTGPTSYRLYEAIQMGCVPVYIGDDFWLPFAEDVRWSDFCILCPIEVVNMGGLDDVLNANENRWLAMRANCKWVYDHFFNMKSCCYNIIQKAMKL